VNWSEGANTGPGPAVAVFGSVARNEASMASDVDILVDFDGPTTFDRYFGVKEELEKVLG